MGIIGIPPRSWTKKEIKESNKLEQLSLEELNEKIKMGDVEILEMKESTEPRVANVEGADFYVIGIRYLLQHSMICLYGKYIDGEQNEKD